LRACGAMVVYAAASSAVLNLIPEGSRVVIGHMALKQSHAAKGSLPSHHADDFADDSRTRQVAGL